MLDSNLAISLKRSKLHETLNTQTHKMITDQSIITEHEIEEDNIKIAEVQNSESSSSSKSRPKPVDRQVPFKIEELFFSITDSKSVIQFANQTFIELSGYSEEELTGELHKIIRHPEMPRTIFKVFWDYLLDNKPVAAYVKNMAKDGSYYWVMALAFPYHGGYLSVRLKPESDHFIKIQSIYKEVLKFEKDQEKKLDKRKALKVTESYLLDTLKEMGFNSYDDFMMYSLEKEMHNREKKLLSHKRKENTENIPKDLSTLQSVLLLLFKNTEALHHMHQELKKHSDYLLKLARSILRLSLNAQVGSSKLDQHHQYLSVVAENMGQQSVIGEKKLLQMQDIVSSLNNLLTKLNFNITTSKLQVEMNNHFIGEISLGKSNFQYSTIEPEEAVDILTKGFMPQISDIKDQITQLPDLLRKLDTGTNEIEKFLHTLRFIHISGIIEVARLNDHGNSFSTTFDDLIKQIKYAEEKMLELTDFIRENNKISRIFTDSRFALVDFLSSVDRKAKLK